MSLDKFTKYNHFLPIHHPYIEIPIAQLFIDHIYKLHGLPLAICSRWCLGTYLHTTPKTDGQIQQVNQCLGTYFQCFVHACPSRWLKWLLLCRALVQYQLPFFRGNLTIRGPLWPQAHSLWIICHRSDGPFRPIILAKRTLPNASLSVSTHLLHA